ncbi:MAG: hypothetical protein P4M05_28440 [Bradyrhizobium sp.]|nr:hypothetical protein [Bradyrhizobium sp.]
MADSLKSYLIDIGYKVDQIAQKQAEEALKRSEERATDIAQKEAAKRAKSEKTEQEKQEKARQAAEKKQAEWQAKSLNQFSSFVTRFAGLQAVLGAVTGLTAAGIVRAVDQAASRFERLNYMSQRVGASAGKISAFGYASSQRGSSTQEADSSLEAFGKNLHMANSGYTEFLENLGVRTRDATGQLRNYVDVATDLGDVLRRQQESGEPNGYARALANASKVGFGEIQARAMMSPDFRGLEDQYQSDQKAIGADPDAAAKSGTAFEQSMRRLLEVLDAIGTKVSTVLFDKLRPLLDDLTKWLLAHGAEVATILGRVADDLVKLAVAIGEKLAGADWDAILGNVEAFAGGLGLLLSKLGGEGGLVALLGLLALRLGALPPLLPPWLLATLGLGAGAVAVEGALKSKFDEVWDARHGAPSAEIQEHRAEGLWGLTKRLWKDGKKALGFGDDDPGKVSGTQGKLDKAEVSAYIRKAAIARGIDPEIALRVARSEGLAVYAGDGSGKLASSFGPFQLHYGGINPIMPNAGLGDAFTKATGLDARDPATFQQQIDFALDQVRKSGWGAWSGARNQGITGFTGVGPLPAPTDDGQRHGAPVPLAPPDKGIKPVSLGPSPIQSMMIANSFRGNLNVSHTPTFNVQGGSSGGSFAVSDLSADRGSADLLRNIQGAEA